MAHHPFPVYIENMCEENATPKTLLVAAFEGWNDASQAATNVIRHLVSRYESQEVRHIDNEDFYDYQVARPMICSMQGRKRIIWPRTTFYDIAVSPVLHLLAQIAPEPNYRWKEYCTQTLHIAEDYGVNDVITLGAMFDECPHTRPLPLDISKSGCECESDREYNGPVGIPNILDAFTSEAGLSTMSMWVSVPHYSANAECMQGTLELLRALSVTIGYPLAEGDLIRKAAQWRAQADELVASTHTGDYLARLERDYDLDAQAKRIASNGMPACEELIREAESFLRDGV